MNEKIKSKILDAFVAMSAKVGHTINERWILHTFNPQLNPKEQAEVEATIEGMKNEDLITVGQRGGMFVMALSQTGYDNIYPTDPVGAKAKIRTAILNRFSATSSKVGHCLPERWIVQNLMPSLNPKDQEQVNSTLQEMETDGVITIERKNSMIALILTQKGFDLIY